MALVMRSGGGGGMLSGDQATASRQNAVNMWWSEQPRRVREILGAMHWDVNEVLFNSKSLDEAKWEIMFSISSPRVLKSLCEAGW